MLKKTSRIDKIKIADKDKRKTIFKIIISP